MSKMVLSVWLFMWLVVVQMGDALLLRQGSASKVFDRLRRQSDRGSLSFGGGTQANISPLAGIVPNTNIGRSTGGNVNVARPNANIGQNTNILGLFDRQRGVENAGVRDGDNVGATWGDGTSLLNGALGWGRRNNVDLNTHDGSLGIQKQKGIAGIATETDSTNVDPLALRFGNQKRKCFGGAFFGGDGICTTENKGLNGRR